MKGSRVGNTRRSDEQAAGEGVRKRSIAPA